MQKLSSITLNQFRNYTQFQANFTESITCITGANGVGKTNLLDAIYFLCYTKSYFSNLHQLSVQQGTLGFRIAGVFEQNEIKGTIICKFKEGKKEVSFNEQVYEKITDHIGKYAAVMIAPDDLEMINAGSELRRKMMDSILCQTETDYLDYLIQYQKILVQRNAWLKQQAIKADTNSFIIDYFNQQLSQTGDFIYQKRKEFTTQFLPLLVEIYKSISNENEIPYFTYLSDLESCSFDELFKESYYHDLRLQRTTKGIHKDDWLCQLDDLAVKQYASQGQKKSFLFALKLAQYRYLSLKMNRYPLLLLDDVFEKLDQQRMEALLGLIKGNTIGQVFITDTHKERAKQAFGTGVPINHIAL